MEAELENKMQVSGNTWHLNALASSLVLRKAYSMDIRGLHGWTHGCIHGHMDAGVPSPIQTSVSCSVISHSL